MASSQFVFYDPSGRRWTRFRRLVGILGILVVIFTGLFVLALISNPQLPSLGLPSVEHLANTADIPSIIRGDKPVVNRPFQDPRVRYIRNNGNPVLRAKLAANPHVGQPLVFGYYVNWDPASIVSLRLNLNRLTNLIPEWLSLENGRGDLTDDSDPTVIRVANDAKLPILAMVTNFRDGWQAGDLHRILRNRASSDNLIDNIYSNLIEHKFAGINIDFEQLKSADRARMVIFMERLRDRLKPGGFLVSQSVPVDDSAYDLKRLGEINDYIIPMLYDEHYQSGDPGPIASEDWFAGQLQKLRKVLPARKTVIGLGNYGYDWLIGGEGASEMSFADVISAAEANHTSIAWDNQMENPVLRYQSGTEKHEVWFLDAVTALNQVGDVSDAGFRGIALWRLGGEDPGLWKVLASHSWPNQDFNPTSLSTMTSQKSVLQFGEGDILRVTETPHDGHRNVWKANDDFAERFDSYPSYYVVEHVGGSNQKIMAITFDDGPSEYTPKILNILKAKNVPAAFFVIGVNAEQFPETIRREYAAGHTVGNHTYTHPNVAAESPEETQLELSTTLRLIEHDTGHATKLFRPPYNADSEPQTPEEITPIVRAQDMQYITIGERDDPRDWEPGIKADAILNEVLAEAENGHIILLHDGGGDRSQTVAALPRLIDNLRARGYRFVSLPELLGKTRDELMPVPSAQELRWANLEAYTLIAKGDLKKMAGLFFLIAIYLTLLRSLVYGALAVSQKLQSRLLRFNSRFRPPVSVIIAAYNEEKVIAKTVASILDNGYPALEIVVVNDGSNDDTYEVLQDAFCGDDRVRLFTQSNRGKAEALNHAMREARYEILIALDADTIFRHGTIEKLVRHFSDPKVGAVSGNARVGNRQKWITRFQSIEYICGFNLDRRALDRLNAITVVPGAVGAWRKLLLVSLGGFKDDTLAEDTDITLALRRLGYKIRYEESAVAYTEAPQDTRSLAKQRFRWAFGTLQAAWKHRDATFNLQYGYLGFVALPSIWLFQVGLAALSPFAEVAMLIALFLGNWPIVLAYYFGLFLLELLTALLAFGLEGERPYDLILLFLQRIYYRQLMLYVLGKSIVFALKGRLVGWGKLERHATVQNA
jgi:cellulose synthase/poly-beta-1,6-N-acetylglucosamine synthase-like glycosyltransferase/peptidoglycan/xylan/chitin deacetylase (PgdA/CDA1 family)/spore germination protein YaaH